MRFSHCVFLAALSLSACPCGRAPTTDTLKAERTACTSDEECETGLCDVVPGTVERLCLRKCTAGCRQSDLCELLSLDRYACVPERAGLCQPCATDSDCPYPADKCLTLGSDHFCGRDCSFDDTCPSTYRCAEGFGTSTTGSRVAKQCQPVSGTCACTAATLGQMVPCQSKNSFGTCAGTQTCGEQGYSTCTARTPAAEVCNGLDDDCNGQTDEALADLSCGVGECHRGAAACANGQPQTCTPGAPTVELCNQKDDDCDGVVDNGFDLQNDVGNCGSCTHACTLTHAVPKCAAGQCAIDHCLPGWSNLDGVAANGCEYPCTPTNNGVEICDGLDNNCDGQVDEGFNLGSDPTNCGQCGLTCAIANGSVATYACVARTCAVGTCATGRGDCNQQYADGCEVDTTTSLTHCGGCGHPCAPANATPSCQAGACRVGACDPGFGDCNGAVADGCETSVSTDVNDCGACGHVCTAANATSSCTNGACHYACQANWYDLDGSPANGCEYACVRTNNGVEACDGIDNDCNGQVDEGFDLQRDPNHCGSCAHACAAPFAASTTCANATCSLATCQAGHGDCNLQYADGCEVDLTSSLANCGGCGVACAPPNAAAACTQGACRVSACLGTWRDCNHAVNDGCEVNIAADTQNCGGCGTVCSLPFAVPACTNGGCAIAQCQPGHVDLDGLPGNGCEYACTPTNGGVEACDGLDNNCNGVADEGFTLSTDAANCGACGHACVASDVSDVSAAQCSGGTCSVKTCQPGFADCDGAFANGCEVNTQTSTANCGGCGVVCAVAHGSPACVSSSCAVAGCAAGFADCDHLVADGGEVDTTSAVSNCGGCGVVCPTPAHTTPSCMVSACQATCTAGWVDLDQSLANGCEYQCTPSGSDVPDLSFQDLDCDGIDGTASAAIFVAPSGDDGNVGTRAAPMRTLNAAISAARVAGKAVYASRGQYNELVTLQAGVSLYGGYDAQANWSRSAANVTTIASPQAQAVLAVNLSVGVELQLFTLTTQDASGTEASGDGRSAIGVLAVNNTGALTLRGCTVAPGAGAAGAPGSAGAPGGDGSPGGNASGVGGGTAGASTCGGTGGVGAGGVSGKTDGVTGGPGTTASGGAPRGAGGSPGSKGNCTTTSASDGFDAPLMTAGGSAGLPGANGVAGASLGSFSALGVYLAPAGGVGLVGQVGGGAGGGGSGGGTQHGSGFACAGCSDMTSGGGGGGGGGGCGGAAGTAGRGGGGSFAVVALSGNVTLDQCTLLPKNGGSGGNGGNGGGGGGGGAGGSGAAGSTYSGGCNSRRAGNGAAGATGGAGGQGGGAAGGTGGPSVCVVVRGSTVTSSGISCTTGAPGAGGLGGSNGLQSAAAGPSGVATNQVTVP